MSHFGNVFKFPVPGSLCPAPCVLCPLPFPFPFPFPFPEPSGARGGRGGAPGLAFWGTIDR
jgi:hypothetical protein